MTSAGRSRPGDQRRQRPRLYGGARSRGCWRRRSGGPSSRPRSPAAPRRRHPPLLCRHLAARARCSASRLRIGSRPTSTSWSAGSTGRRRGPRRPGDRGARAAGAGGVSAARCSTSGTGAGARHPRVVPPRRARAGRAGGRGSAAPRRAPSAHRHLLGRLPPAGRRRPGTTGCCRRSRGTSSCCPACSTCRPRSRAARPPPARPRTRRPTPISSTCW